MMEHERSPEMVKWHGRLRRRSERLTTERGCACLCWPLLGALTLLGCESWFCLYGSDLQAYSIAW